MKQLLSPANDVSRQTLPEAAGTVDTTAYYHRQTCPACQQVVLARKVVVIPPSVIVRCPECQHAVSVDDLANDGRLNAYYAQDYQPFTGSMNKLHPDKSWRFPKPQGNAALLDVGCGSGRYLLQMSQLGWLGTGLDPFADAGACVKSQSTTRGATSDVTIIHTQLADLKTQSPFDLITMWEVLEHVDDPLATLADVRRLLAVGGELRLSVPNSASWAADYFAADWFGWDVPRHRNHFSPVSMRKLLTYAGFEMKSVSTISHPSWIRKSLSRRRSSRPTRADRLLASRLGSGCWSRWQSWWQRGEGIGVIALRTA